MQGEFALNVFNNNKRLANMAQPYKLNGACPAFRDSVSKALRKSKPGQRIDNSRKRRH